jgi:hypothetical protein
MSTEVHEGGQLSVAISNVIATDDELAKLRGGLTKAFTKIRDLSINFDRVTPQGARFDVRFSILGPVYFEDKHLIDVLHAIPLVRWRIDYQAGPEGHSLIL